MKIGVLVAQGLDVPNFLKDVLKVPKSILRWKTTFNHFLRVSKVINGP